MLPSSKNNLPKQILKGETQTQEFKSSLRTIEVGRFSSDTIIKESMTIRTDLLSEVDLVFEFAQKHISQGYYFYVSSIRNKQIAVIFKEAGLIEKYGSGIRRVIKAFEEYQLELPVFEEFQHGFRATVFKTPQKTPQIKPVRLKILDLLLEESTLSQRAVAEKLGISFDTVKEHFAKLKKENRIKRKGSKRSGYWEVLER